MKKISNYILTILIILFCFGLIFFSSSNINSIHIAIDLFINAIFPSLFPFLIVSELLSHTKIISQISLKFEKIMKKVFNAPPIGAYPFAMSLLSGYPVGAKIISTLRSQNKISKIDAERLLIYTSNSSPLFIIGSIGTSIYQNSSIGFLLYFTHLLSCIITGIIFGHLYKKAYREIEQIQNYELSFSTIGEILGDAIKKAFITLSIVCGFVILFSLIISMIQETHILAVIFGNNFWPQYITLGTLEITSGIKLISQISVSSLTPNLIATAFLLGLGGISVLLQIWSIISKTDLSIKPYIVGKSFNAILSASIMFLLTLI